ncbi:uncharacterized protein CTRU02_202976 [Colletotrichum truncatum]|uniref:Uncharacterized protein n=1 Tax=Colletotrichum truncatum TaxID=5467 RepID=A0ACC3Z819_COLTU|nr:uncharacterized protein CTRU02_13201 [Colletotrichum truncatum]KAF6783693.1 hypothetical protein CTRU02_13201 [Colletotrichum truncatum]
MFITQLILALSVAHYGYCWKFTTETDFRNALMQKEDTLVAYTNTDSIESKKLELEWAEVQEQNLNAVAINCLRDRELCDENDIASFPVIRFYREDGSMQRYRGPRKANEITGFLRRMKRSEIKELKEETGHFHKGDDIVLVARLAQNDENLRTRFQSLARNFRDRYSFGLVNTSGASSSVSCYNNINGVHYNANDLSSVVALQTLIQQCVRPLVAQMTRRNEREYLNAGKSLVYFFTSDDKRRDEYIVAIRSLAKRFQEYLSFVTVDSAEYPDMSSQLGLAEDEKGSLALQNPQTGQAFPHSGKITAQEVEQFIVDISEGKVQAWNGQAPVSQWEGNAGTHDEL